MTGIILFGAGFWVGFYVGKYGKLPPFLDKIKQNLFEGKK